MTKFSQLEVKCHALNCKPLNNSFKHNKGISFSTNIIKYNQLTTTLSNTTFKNYKIFLCKWTI